MPLEINEFIGKGNIKHIKDASVAKKAPAVKTAATKTASKTKKKSK